MRALRRRLIDPRARRSTLRILLVKLSSLGDVVHAMPAVQDIVAAHPGAVVDWVVEPAFAPLVQRVAGIGEVIGAPLRRWRQGWWTQRVRSEFNALRERLRRHAYDAVLDLQGLTKSAVIARLALLAPGGIATASATVPRALRGNRRRAGSSTGRSRSSRTSTRSTARA